MSPAEWEIRWLDEVDSTNTYVRDRAHQGAPEGLVVVADHQTAGRGRLDRRWESPPGANLLASVLLRPRCDGADVHLCTGAVALAAADACREVAGVEPVLKWPNDLLVGGSKLAGILAEAEFSGRRPGRGRDRHRDQRGLAGTRGGGGDLPGRRGRVGAAGGPPGPSRPPAGGALGAVARCSTRRAGGAALADEVRRRCATLGQPVRVTLAGEEFTGLAAAIDDAGHLVVETASGPRRVTAGDVVHLRPG